MSISLPERTNADHDELPMVVRLQPVLNLTDDQFFALAQLNRDLRLERTASGELIMMPPTGGGAGQRNAAVSGQLWAWTKQDKTGVCFDSSTGFRLANGAIRSLDAAWVSLPRWNALTDEQREKYPPLCPEFVIEIRSNTDSLSLVQAKMDEYLANGTRLGWLIDPLTKTVVEYEAGQEPRENSNASKVNAGTLLPGFELDLQEIW